MQKIMQRLLRERAAEAFAWLVPARHRATLGLLLPGGERRCDRQSRCGRQAAELIQLLLRHAAEDDDEADEAQRKQAECIALLDSPDRFLTTGGTCQLALATVREAFLQAQQNTMPCDRDRMLGVIGRLERLDQLLRVMMTTTSHHHSPGPAEEEHSLQALLRHEGRGIELMQRQSRSFGA